MIDIYATFFLIAMQYCRYDKFNLDVNSKECVERVYNCMKARNKLDNATKDCVLK